MAKSSNTAGKKSSQKKRMDEVSRHAARLFRKKGYLATTMNDIAHSMKIKKGSLYYYTDDKETLLFNILDKTMDDMLGFLEELDDPQMPPGEQLAKAIRTHINNAVRYIDQFSVLLHDTQHLNPSKRKIILQKRTEYEDIFVGYVRQCKEQGIFKDVDDKIAVYMILGSCNWLYQWFNPRGTKNPEEIADIFIDVFFKGLLN